MTAQAAGGGARGAGVAGAPWGEGKMALGGLKVKKGNKAGVLKEKTYRLGGDPSAAHLPSETHCLSPSQPKGTRVRSPEAARASSLLRAD